MKTKVIMSKNFLKAQQENTAEVQITFSAKPEDINRIMEGSSDLASIIRRRYGTEYLVRADDEESPKPISVPQRFWKTNLHPKKKAELERIRNEIMQNFKECAETKFFINFEGRKGKLMTKKEVREVLEKQLLLLAERSQTADTHELMGLSQVMSSIGYQLEPTLQE